MILTPEDYQRFARAQKKLAEVHRRLREDPHDDALLLEEIRLSGTVACYWTHIEMARAREQLDARWN